MSSRKCKKIKKSESKENRNGIWRSIDKSVKCSFHEFSFWPSIVTKWLSSQSDARLCVATEQQTRKRNVKRRGKNGNSRRGVVVGSILMRSGRRWPKQVKWRGKKEGGGGLEGEETHRGWQETAYGVRRGGFDEKLIIIKDEQQRNWSIWETLQERQCGWCRVNDV